MTLVPPVLLFWKSVPANGLPPQCLENEERHLCCGVADLVATTGRPNYHVNHFVNQFQNKRKVTKRGVLKNWKQNLFSCPTHYARMDRSERREKSWILVERCSAIFSVTKSWKGFCFLQTSAAATFTFGNRKVCSVFCGRRWMGLPYDPLCWTVSTLCSSRYVSLQKTCWWIFT